MTMSGIAVFQLAGRLTSVANIFLKNPKSLRNHPIIAV